MTCPKRLLLQPDPSLADVADDPALPGILLIGDSISMGYTIPVRNLLKGKANVHRIPENGGPTTNGLAKLPSWLGDNRWDVIHFNWGLHDLKIMPDGLQQVSPEIYENNLRKLVQQLKATKAKLIWASTTPVPEGVKNPVRHSSDVSTYNAIAKKIMEEQRIAIDDLYTFPCRSCRKFNDPRTFTSPMTARQFWQNKSHQALNLCCRKRTNPERHERPGVDEMNHVVLTSLIGSCLFVVNGSLDAASLLPYMPRLEDFTLMCWENGPQSYLGAKNAPTPTCPLHAKWHYRLCQSIRKHYAYFAPADSLKEWISKPHCKTEMRPFLHCRLSHSNCVWSLLKELLFARATRDTEG
jgi:hypothetical protein